MDCLSSVICCCYGFAVAVVTRFGATKWQHGKLADEYPLLMITQCIIWRSVPLYLLFISNNTYSECCSLDRHETARVAFNDASWSCAMQFVAVSQVVSDKPKSCDCPNVRSAASDNTFSLLFSLFLIAKDAFVQRHLKYFGISVQRVNRFDLEVTCQTSVTQGKSNYISSYQCNRWRWILRDCCASYLQFSINVCRLNVQIYLQDTCLDLDVNLLSAIMM